MGMKDRNEEMKDRNEEDEWMTIRINELMIDKNKKQ